MKNLVVVLGLLAACAGTPAATVQVKVDVRVRTDVGDAVPGASVALDAVRRGVTDSTGLLRTIASGAGGQRVRVEVACPAGYRARSSALEVVLRRADETVSRASQPFSLDAECLPETRHGVLVVRVVGASRLPLLINGDRMGDTGVTGLAHIPVSLVPGTSLRVTLDTSADPRLRPVNPSRRFAIEDRDSLLVLDQAFAAEKSKPVFPRHRDVPYRIH